MIKRWVEKYRIRPWGMLIALALMGIMLLVVWKNKLELKTSSQVWISSAEARMEELESGNRLMWVVYPRYKHVEVIDFTVDSTYTIAGSTIYLNVENDKDVADAAEYAIDGLTSTESYAVGLTNFVGKGNELRVSAYAQPEVLEKISSICITYLHPMKGMLAILAWSSILLFFALGFRMDTTKEGSFVVVRVCKAVFTISVPVLVVYAMEYLGGTIPGLDGKYLGTNIVILMLLYLLVFLLCNRLRISMLVVTGLGMLLGYAEYFVLLFRGSPITPLDITSFTTAMSVVDQYTIEINLKLILATYIFLVVLVVSSKLTYRIHSRKKRMMLATGGVVLTMGLGVLFYRNIYSAWGLSYSTWAPIETYSQNGYLLSTLIYAKNANMKSPDGYSVKRAQEILQKYENELYAREEETTEEDGMLPERIQPDNLIVIMNESWSDLGYIRKMETSMPYSSFYDNLTENTIKGNLFVSVYGGNTPQTEYEFFTGNTVTQTTPSAIAYEFFVDEDTWTICDPLLTDSYRCFAMHPYEASGYNRDNVYSYMGFEEFYSQEAFEGTEILRYFHSDRATYDKIIELYETKETGEKLFVWDLTMQNHGGYTTTGNMEADVFYTQHPELRQAAVYLSMMKQTDLALENLLAYFAQEEETVMVVMFGDHQPRLSDGTYDILFEQEAEALQAETLAKQYVTPFLIWTNYETEEAYIDRMSVNYLSSYVFERAGMELEPYQKLLMELYEYYPVIHAQGVYDAEGTYWTWDEVDQSEHYDKLREYRIVEYYQIKK